MRKIGFLILFIICIGITGNAFAVSFSVGANYDTYSGSKNWGFSGDVHIPVDEKFSMYSALIYKTAANYTATFTTDYTGSCFYAGGGLAFNLSKDAVSPGIRLEGGYTVSKKIFLDGCFDMGLNAENVLEPCLFYYNLVFTYKTFNSIAKIQMLFSDEHPADYTRTSFFTDATIIAYEEGVPFSIQVGLSANFITDSRFEGTKKDTVIGVSFGFDKQKNKTNTFLRFKTDVYSFNKVSAFPFCITLGKSFNS